MNSLEPPIESPIEQKISWARDIIQCRGQELLGDEKLMKNLVMLKQAVAGSREESARLGIGDYCRSCEEQEGGSCCGAGIERNFNAVLILLNLLLKAEIPELRYDPSSCFFLSESGCRLLARHVLCVNFLCRKITSAMNPRRLAALREKEGVELNLIFTLHERLKKNLAGSPK
ncbi:MAG: hypothetical protein JW836_04925 [Deltaproteobacteria bacterium]|nr:hypothetical protein [Deltaproteobacteria bacterium]